MHDDKPEIMAMNGEVKHFLPLDYEDQRGILGQGAWSLLDSPYWESGLMEKPFQWSPFAFLIKRRHYSVLYHSLNLRKIVGDGRLGKLFARGRRGRPLRLGEYLQILKSEGGERALEEVELLVRHGFLIPHGVEPYGPLKARQQERRFFKPQVGLLYLLLSNDCNLRCGYCTIESPGRKPGSFRYSHMTKETARAGIDLLLEVLDPHVNEPRVIYYGGEPLLNPDTYFDSLAYIREKDKLGLFNGMSCEAAAVCNGTMITEEIVRKMKEFSASASVSLDGLKRHHDRMRKYRDGRGSFDDALRGYHLIRKHLGSCGISCTLGPHNYEDIEEIAEFFATRLECRGMGFNIMKGLPPGNDVEVPADLITRQIIKAYKILRKFGIYEDRIMRKVKSFINEEPWIYDCGGYGGQIALCADGYIGPCHIAADDHRFCWGHIDEGNLKDEILGGQLMKQWCARSPLMMEECFDCIGLGICGGGCADEAYVKSGALCALDKSFCEHCKCLVEWLCEDLAEKLMAAGTMPRQGMSRVREGRYEQG
jgi:uncharacterized protein